MSARISQRTRIISVLPGGDELDADDSRTAMGRARSFDYSRLLCRRSSPHRPLENDVLDGTTASDAPPHDVHRNDHDTPIGGQLTAERQLHEPSESLNLPAIAADRAMIAPGIADTAEPVVSAALAQDRRFIQPFAMLARGIAAFCGDPAIVTAGYWHATVPLDPGVLPNTTLHLTLSPFALQLRFDASDPATRQVLLQHSTVLERELDVLLRAWAEVRSVELTVW